MLVTTQVNAQDEAGKSGGYIAGGVGLTIKSDGDVYTDAASMTVANNAGVGLSFAGGYKFGGGARLEAELGYRRNGADTVGGGKVDGAVSSVSIMVNGAFDFDTGSPWAPYVGAGIGVAGVVVDVKDGATTLADAVGMGFAYQGRAGVGYNITPNVTMSFDYRLMGTTDVPITLEDGTDVHLAYLTHSFMLGTRYNF